MMVFPLQVGLPLVMMITIKSSGCSQWTQRLIRRATNHVTYLKAKMSSLEHQLHDPNSVRFLKNMGGAQPLEKAETRLVELQAEYRRVAMVSSMTELVLKMVDNAAELPLQILPLAVVRMNQEYYEHSNVEDLLEAIPQLGENIGKLFASQHLAWTQPKTLLQKTLTNEAYGERLGRFLDEVGEDSSCVAVPVAMLREGGGLELALSSPSQEEADVWDKTAGGTVGSSSGRVTAVAAKPPSTETTSAGTSAAKPPSTETTSAGTSSAAGTSVFDGRRLSLAARERQTTTLQDLAKSQVQQWGLNRPMRIEVHNLSLRWNGAGGKSDGAQFDSTSVLFEEGRAYRLVGKTGAGKSTLLSMLAADFDGTAAMVEGSIIVNPVAPFGPSGVEDFMLHVPMRDRQVKFITPPVFGPATPVGGTEQVVHHPHDILTNEPFFAELRNRISFVKQNPSSQKGDGPDYFDDPMWTVKGMLLHLNTDPELQKLQAERRFSELEDRLWEVLKVVKMDEDISTKCVMKLDGFLARELGPSGGMQQRLKLAKALLRKPGLILLDETTSGIDKETLPEVIANVRRYMGKSATLIFIAHQEGICEMLGDCAEYELNGDDGKWRVSKEVLEKKV